MAAAVIIAGGMGSRMGGAIKSELVVGGVRLLERVRRRLTQCEPLLVAHGRHDPALLRLPAGLVAVPDFDVDYGGPLAGLAAAVGWLNSHDPGAEILVAAAVDTPHLPDDFVSRLLAGIAGQQAALASYAGQAYPTNSAWRLAAIAGLPDEVRAGTAPRSLKRLAESLGAASVSWPDGPAGDPFANANTPEELAALNARAHADGL